MNLICRSIHFDFCTLLPVTSLSWLSSLFNETCCCHADCGLRGVLESSRLSSEPMNGCGHTNSPTRSRLNKTREDLTRSVVVAESCHGELARPAQPHEAACASRGEQRLGLGAEGFKNICDLTTELSPAVEDLTTFRRESGIGRSDGTSGRPPDDVRMQSCHEPRDQRGGDAIKKAVSDYVVLLLTPLYKTRKIQKEDFKAIVKKSTAKVSIQLLSSYGTDAVPVGYDKMQCRWY